MPRLPDKQGHFGAYGGRYVAETLMPALIELEEVYRQCRRDPAFKRALRDLQHEYVGRPTPLTYAARLTERLGGAKIYLKREDLCHTGEHKINNTIGQALLAKRMGKHRLIAETGAGQHGVATATVAALLGRVRSRAWPYRVPVQMRTLGVSWRHEAWRLPREFLRLGDGPAVPRDPPSQLLPLQRYSSDDDLGGDRAHLT